MGVEYRELFIKLIYRLMEFSEQELVDKLSAENVNINNIFSFQEYLMSLQEIGTLKYDGNKYRVIPAEERLFYRKFTLRATAY